MPYAFIGRRPGVGLGVRDAIRDSTSVCGCDAGVLGGLTMALKVTRVDVWVASIVDRPGGLAQKLGALADAGAELEFIIARRAPEKPGTGVVFLTPLKGAAQLRAAKKARFRKTKNLHSVRVEGQDKPGLGARLTQALAERGVNLRGLSAGVIGRRFVAHFALDSSADAAKALRILKKVS